MAYAAVKTAYIDENVRDYVSIDLSNARRVFTCGDVHGRYDLLRASLDEVGFSGADGDWLIMIGDLLDRGPSVLEIRDLLESDDHILWIRGNHEHILQGSLFREHTTDDANAMTLMHNGGDWLMDYVGDVEREDVIVRLLQGDNSFVDPQIIDFARMLGEAPVAVRVRTPGGRVIGLVHADVPARDWASMAQILTSEDHLERGRMAARCMWSRERFNAYHAYGHDSEFDCTVEGVDHVFFGHSPAKDTITHSNCSWIDTGAFSSGILTLVDIDQWVAAHS